MAFRMARAMSYIIINSATLASSVKHGIPQNKALVYRVFLREVNILFAFRTESIGLELKAARREQKTVGG